MVVLSTELYDRICGYIGQYNGLTIDCDRDIRKEFPAIDTHTLSAVLSKEWQKRIKRHHYTVLQNAQAILKRYVNKNGEQWRHQETSDIPYMLFIFSSFLVDSVDYLQRHPTILIYSFASLSPNVFHPYRCAAFC